MTDRHGWWMRLLLRETGKEVYICIVVIHAELQLRARLHNVGVAMEKDG